MKIVHFEHGTLCIYLLIILMYKNHSIQYKEKWP
jgi:hypothetical protein